MRAEFSEISTPRLTSWDLLEEALAATGNGDLFLASGSGIIRYAFAAPGIRSTHSCHSSIIRGYEGFFRRLNESDQCMISSDAHASASDFQNPVRVTFKPELRAIHDSLRACDAGVAYNRRKRYHFQLDIDHRVLCEIIRFIYTGASSTEGIDDLVGFHIELLVKSDHWAIDPLFEYSLEFFQTSGSVQSFYDLESVYSLGELRERAHHHALFNLICALFCRHMSEIYNHADFSILSTELLVSLVKAAKCTLPQTLVHRWNVNLDKPLSDVAEVEALLSKGNFEPIDGLILVDRTAGKSASVRGTIRLSSPTQQIRFQPIEYPRRLSLRVQNLVHNTISLCEGIIQITQRPEAGIYAVRQLDMTGHLTGSSLGFQIDLLFKDKALHVLQGDMEIVHAGFAVSFFSLEIEVQEDGEENLIDIF